MMSYDNLMTPHIRKKRKRTILYILLVVLFLYLMKECKYLEPHVSEALNNQDLFPYSNYIVPYLRGQGLNNQLWELRSSAYIAKAENRVLCLVPFHRFYMQKSGRERPVNSTLNLIKFESNNAWCERPRHLGLFRRGWETLHHDLEAPNTKA